MKVCVVSHFAELDRTVWKTKQHFARLIRLKFGIQTKLSYLPMSPHTSNDLRTHVHCLFNMFGVCLDGWSRWLNILGAQVLCLDSWRDLVALALVPTLVSNRTSRWQHQVIFGSSPKIGIKGTLLATSEGWTWRHLWVVQNHRPSRCSWGPFESHCVWRDTTLRWGVRKQEGER